MQAEEIINQCGWKVVDSKHTTRTVYKNKIGESTSDWHSKRLIGQIPESQVAEVSENVMLYQIVPMQKINADDEFAHKMAANPIVVESALCDAGFDARWFADVTSKGIFVGYKI